MSKYNFSPKSVESILNDPNWIDFYDEKINYCLNNLNPSEFPESFLKTVIEPHLINILSKETNDNIHQLIFATAQNWGLQSTFKSEFLIRLLQIIPNELKALSDLEQRYKNVPIGSISDEIFKDKSNTERKTWFDVSNLIMHRKTCSCHFTSLFFSESFFVFEAFLRTIAMSSCLEFALKTIIPNTVIQHKEIYQVINRKCQTNDNNKIACLICPMANKCSENHAYRHLNEAYLLLYHLRVIKDYKLNYHDSEVLSKIANRNFIERIFKIICITEEIQIQLFKNFWNFPRTIKESSQIIFSLEKNQ